MSLEDLIRRHEAGPARVDVRGIGRRASELHALEARHKAGLHAVPPCDVHRFNVQLSGRQSLRTFSMDRMLTPAPALARPGTVSFVPAGRALDFLTGGDDFHAFQVLIPRSHMRRALRDVLGADLADDEGLLGHIGAPTERLSHLARLLHDEFRASGRGGVAMMEALVQALCLELVRHLNAPPAAPSRAVALTEAERTRVLALMEEAVGGGLSLGDIAETLGLDPYQLSRRFRARFGETPRRYLLRQRLARARRLLEDSDMPLAEIAFACGFSSQAHMTTAFSQRLGITPARYRAKRRMETRHLSATPSRL